MQPTHSTDGAALKILLIDDDEAQLRCMEYALVPAGYEAFPCSNPKKAVAMACTGHYDLAITDVKMPRMNGIEVLKAIKAGTENTRVIMITGFPEMSQMLEAMKHGVDGFFTKPLEFNALIEKIGEIENDICRESRLDTRRNGYPGQIDC